MMPIRMETQCSGCHSLHFDEHDPTSGVPHGDLQRMYRALREHFSRQYLEAARLRARTAECAGPDRKRARCLSMSSGGHAIGRIRSH